MNKIAIILIVFLTGMYIGDIRTSRQYSMQVKELSNIISNDRTLLSSLNKKLVTMEDELKINVKKKDIFIATAYCNDPICINVSMWNDGKTAMGTVARLGVVAVDPKVIPLGTDVYIEGMGWFKAEDVGGKIKGKRIDIFLGDLQKAREFGKKKIIIYY